MDKAKSPSEKTAKEIVEGFVGRRARPVAPQISNDKKPSLLQRLRERDKPALATPEAHGPG